MCRTKLIGWFAEVAGKLSHDPGVGVNRTRRVEAWHRQERSGRKGAALATAAATESPDSKYIL